MKLERRGVKVTRLPGYPAANQVDSDLRRFLKRVGGGVLGVSMVGLASCEPVTEQVSLPETKDSEWEHVEMMGVAPADLIEMSDEDFVTPGGIEEPDLISGDSVNVKDLEPEWVTAGIPPWPEDAEVNVDPDVVVPPADLNETDEWPPLPGEAPDPDVKDVTTNPDSGPEVDVVEQDVDDEDAEPDIPPMAGDMPMPEDGGGKK